MQMSLKGTVKGLKIALMGTVKGLQMVLKGTVKLRKRLKMAPNGAVNWLQMGNLPISPAPPPPIRHCGHDIRNLFSIRTAFVNLYISCVLILCT